MKIIIDYESSWRNSFLDPNTSNNEPLPKKGRKFIGSMTNLKKPENFIKREITLDTVMGVLNRVIGDQRKLYQARGEDDYFFKDIDYADSDKVIFKDSVIETSEITFIRNITGSTDQNAFTGAIKTNDAMFSSGYSAEFWGVLALDFEGLCQFIAAKTKVIATIDADPVSIIGKLELLNKEKAVANEGIANEALEYLKQTFEGVEYLNKKSEIMPISLYCSALYLQLERLAPRFNMDSAKTKAGGISGISKRGFTTKDFMSRFTTGEKKKIWGNPYIRKERIKGVGEVTSLMTKASGQLEINLDVSREKAKEIKVMIENAGVSSFYLGKKGLAYISQDIDTRELKQ
ncbi:MAG: type I-Fv CRISPR-associated protein Cas5fv [Methyloprofundus sp.]|nr:type I-Fv CRISPR-associated protein Cas5fv [Methyloprofundus sp.]